MGHRIVDITLDNLGDAPPEPLNSVFWELDDEPTVEPRFEKEEWFSMALLEWGTCGKLAYEDDGAVGFAEYAPPAMFPRLGRFRCGGVSPDAVYLSYCYVAPERRGSGVGTTVLRAVASDLLARGFRALEALGDREAQPGWVLPTGFLTRNGFAVLRDDHRFPLLRLDLRGVERPKETAAAAAAWVEVPVIV